MDNREANIYQHPPTCTCVDCCNQRRKQLHKQQSFDPRFNSNGTVDKRFSPSVYSPTPHNKRSNMTTHKSPKHITHNVLIGIAVIFAILSGISAMAWLLPNAFNSLGIWLVNTTGNSDIQLNFNRIGINPIPYLIIFALIALFVKWLASKFI